MSADEPARAFQGATTEAPRRRAERVLASELDPALPTIPIGDWIRETVGTKSELQWTRTACPATHEPLDPNPAKWAVCVLVTAANPARRAIERPLAARRGELVVAVSIRLGTGNPNVGAWALERPQVEDAFIERDNDSLTVPRLRDLPTLLRLTPRQWPKSDLSVSPSDVHCDKPVPAPGETVRCWATIHNRGGVDAIARVYPTVAEDGNDVGVGGVSIPMQTVPANGHAVVSWRWVWPTGRAWFIGVWAELHTPHAWGGYRLPIIERNVENNSVYVKVPSR